MKDSRGDQGVASLPAIRDTWKVKVLPWCALVLAAVPGVAAAGDGESALSGSLGAGTFVLPGEEEDETIGPTLFEKLGQITTVVAVLQDWDEPREEFLRQVKALGTAVRVVIVHEGPTTRPWAEAEALGEVSLMSVADVERALAKSAPQAPKEARGSAHA